MTPAELALRQERERKAEKHALECAQTIFVLLDFDPDAVLRFRRDLRQIIALWKMKDQVRTPATPARARAIPFRVLEGGRPPA